MDEIVELILDSLKAHGVNCDKIEGEPNLTYGLEDQGGERFFLTIEPA